MRNLGASAVCAAIMLSAARADAAPIYLNSTNIASLGLGPAMTAEPFGNRTTSASLASVIDAPTAASSELHNQTTHVWVNGGTLQLVFDFGTAYDLTQLHFWNYHTESFDVDNIAFTFFDAAHVQVGAFSVQPLLGGSSASDANPIFAQNYALGFSSNVRYVDAVLTGSNGQVDFNNLGFTAELSSSPVPEPASMLLLGTGLLGAGVRRWRRRN